MIQLGTVNRIEVIDHTFDGGGRAYGKWVDYPFEVSFDVQDDERTIKIFLINEQRPDSEGTADHPDVTNERS